MKVIVTPRPLGHKYPGVSEVLDAVIFKELASHPVVKRFNKPVMPWLARRNKRLNHLILASPGLQGVGDEFQVYLSIQITRSLPHARVMPDRVARSPKPHQACDRWQR